MLNSWPNRLLGRMTRPEPRIVEFNKSLSLRGSQCEQRVIDRRACLDLLSARVIDRQTSQGLANTLPILVMRQPVAPQHLQERDAQQATPAAISCHPRCMYSQGFAEFRQANPPRNRLVSIVRKRSRQ